MGNWKNRNPEKHREYSKKYYWKNRSKVLAYSKDRYRDLVSKRLCPHCGLSASSNSVYCSDHLKKERARHLKETFNLSPEAFFSMVDRQNNKCAICQETPSKFDIDHDHKTGRIRGLLCHPCNMGLGGFKDNPGSLRRAIHYLEE